MTTSDAMELPAEGEVVLAWGVDYASLVYRDRGRWMDFMTKGVTHNQIDGWIPLSLARKAREIEAVAQRVADEYCNDMGPSAHPCGKCVACCARAALRDAGMGGGA